MSEQPETEPLKETPEPTTGADQARSAASDNADETAPEGGVTPSRAQMQAIMEGAAVQPSVPYQMLPQFNIGVHPSIPAALLGQLPKSAMKIQAQFWQGQLPPPDAMEHYEKVLPGSFDRILKMAERQQIGQIDNINLAQSYASRDVRRGHYLGFSLSALAMLAAAWFVHEHQPYIAALCLGVPVLSVARAFIDGAQPKQKKPEAKSASNAPEQNAQ
jgi:uncharacterized membrane protein